MEFFIALASAIALLGLCVGLVGISVIGVGMPR